MPIKKGTKQYLAYNPNTAELRRFYSEEDRRIFLSENSGFRDNALGRWNKSVRYDLNIDFKEKKVRRKDLRYYISDGINFKCLKSKLAVDVFLSNNSSWKLNRVFMERNGIFYIIPDDKLEIIHKYHKGRIPWNLNKPWSDEMRNKLSEANYRFMRNNPMRSIKSKTELKIFEYLSNYFITKSSYFIKGGYKHAYDIYVKLPNGVNLLIEYDGDLWHKDTDYNNDIREIEARKQGYEYLVIKEFEFNAYDGLKYVKSRVAEYYPDLINFHLKDAKNIKYELYK